MDTDPHPLMRYLWRGLVALTAAGWLNPLTLPGASQPADKSRPNIVYILADDLGYGDVHFLNPERGRIPTPNIDRLATQGVTFTDAHSGSSVCSPTRYGLLTVFVPAVVPFIPLPLKVFVISAGAMRTSTSRFLAVVLLARLLRYFGEAYLGIRLGEGALGFLTNNAWKIAGVALAAALILLGLVKWYDRGRAEA